MLTPLIYQTVRSNPLFPDGVTAYKNPYLRSGFTCEGSANAWGVANEDQVKSLAFQTRQKRIVMVHICGNEKVVVPALTKALGARPEMVSEEQLLLHGLEKCRVNPFTASHYLGPDVLHILTPNLAKKKVIYTNHDSHHEFIEFDFPTLVGALDHVLYLPASAPKAPVAHTPFERERSASYIYAPTRREPLENLVARLGLMLQGPRHAT